MAGSLVKLDFKHVEDKNSPRVGSPMFPLQLTGRRKMPIRKMVLKRKENSEHCRMDLPGPTTSVGTRTDYSVGPWDYLTCTARHLMA
jgi:hypothetical protein